MSEHEFIKLAYARDDDKCVAYVNANSDFHKTEIYYNFAGDISPLMVACIHGLAKTVTALLNQNADVNYTDKHGTNAMIYSCCCSDKSYTLNIIKQLVAHNADVNHKNHYNNSALLLADSCNITDVGQYLIQLSLNNDAEDNNKITSCNLTDLIDKYIDNKRHPFCMFTSTGYFVPSIRKRYCEVIKHAVDDVSENNMLAVSFRTTYVIQLVDLIAAYII
ncbi:MAG: hypothetical protein Faunusvirus20_12 [Faunusvirus sp.]|jgi:hypothetical protein|uniref:Uncharacterized protein n=1 Tax=Faunusvirus sp. TaxID=2487766 RepID=A0A3G5A213_9VIRU|nr:MAG: hypothetical protein Faunusvirus20_12 [Faunusvirus sp.]